MLASFFGFGPDDYAIHPSPDYSVLLAKFFSSSALHLMLYPEVARTMQLLKYIVNHQDKFANPGIAFLVAFTSLTLNLATELVNIALLLYQHSVEHAIIHFVALEVIAEIPHIYMGSLINDKLKEIVFEEPHLHVTKRGRDIKFKDRGCLSKV